MFTLIRGCGPARQCEGGAHIARIAGAAVVLALWLSAAPGAAQPSPPSPGVLAAWVELSPTGPVVRVITAAASCPRAAPVDAPGAPPVTWETPMTVRAEPAPPDFPNLVCEWQPPSTARYIQIEGEPSALRLPMPNPRRIVVLGDSGCFGGSTQDCERDWPFPDIARFAAARQPDLVIHLGDYNYRGTNCVAYDGCCTYNPVTCGFPNCGDSWDNWQTDFFTPAAPLLAAAPWVTVRGNHELCGRTGRGWFRYLDPHSPPPTCARNPVEHPTYTAPFPLYLGDNLRLVVLDSASACGELAERDDVAEFREQFARLDEHAANGTSRQTWLVSHRAMWSILKSSGQQSTVLNYTLQQASQNRLPAPISLVFSGHEHLFQALTMEQPGFPPSLVVGTGGAVLDNPVDVPARVEQVPTTPDGPTIAVATTVHDHGYLLIELADTGWIATFYDLYDQPIATCASSAGPSLCSLVPR
jgi:hypothetical protein